MSGASKKLRLLILMAVIPMSLMAVWSGTALGNHVEVGQFNGVLLAILPLFILPVLPLAYHVVAPLARLVK